MSLIGHSNAKETEDCMTIAVAGLLPKIMMMLGSIPSNTNVTKKSRLKDELIEPEKNWAELNPDFDVPHREYE